MVAQAQTFTAFSSSPKQELYPVLGKPTETTLSSQGLELAVRRWEPKNEAKAVVLFHHGGCGWHSAYSDTMGKALSSSGIAVVAYDQVGCGYSGGERAIFDSLNVVCDDYTKVLEKVKADYPGKQVFAMGESFGGTVILTQSLREQGKLEAGKEGTVADGYIFTGPVINLLPEMLPPKPLILIFKLISKFAPGLEMPATDFFSTFDLAFGDKKWADTGRNDPFVQEAAATGPRMGMVVSVLSGIEQNNRSFADVKMPLKILVGEKEGRVDVDAIRKLYEEASSTDKDMEVVPGAYHQLFQDLPEVTGKVCDSASTWILERA